jgi:hypothetical protein
LDPSGDHFWGVLLELGPACLSAGLMLKANGTNRRAVNFTWHESRMGAGRRLATTSTDSNKMFLPCAFRDDKKLEVVTLCRVAHSMALRARESTSNA